MRIKCFTICLFYVAPIFNSFHISDMNIWFNGICFEKAGRRLLKVHLKHMVGVLGTSFYGRDIAVAGM